MALTLKVYIYEYEYLKKKKRNFSFSYNVREHILISYIYTNFKRECHIIHSLEDLCNLPYINDIAYIGMQVCTK